MTVPFLLSLDFKKTSTWTSDDRQSSQIYRHGSASIDELSKALVEKKNFFLRCLSKKKNLGSEIELQEIIVAAYNPNSREIGTIFLVIENLNKRPSDVVPINSINATGIFERFNEIRSGKYLEATNQLLLFL